MMIPVKVLEIGKDILRGVEVLLSGISQKTADAIEVLDIELQYRREAPEGDVLTEEELKMIV